MDESSNPIDAENLRHILLRSCHTDSEELRSTTVSAIHHDFHRESAFGNLVPSFRAPQYWRLVFTLPVLPRLVQGFNGGVNITPNRLRNAQFECFYSSTLHYE